MQSVGALEFTTTWIYTLAHTTGFAVMFLWVWFRRRENYPMFRNWFWMTNALAVVGYCALPAGAAAARRPRPGRPHEGVRWSSAASLSWFQPFRNEFAAMPSMHVGYSFLFALTIFWLNAALAAGAGWPSCGRPGCCSP